MEGCGGEKISLLLDTGGQDFVLCDGKCSDAPPLPRRFPVTDQRRGALCLTKSTETPKSLSLFLAPKGELGIPYPVQHTVCAPFEPRDQVPLTLLSVKRASGQDQRKKKRLRGVSSACCKAFFCPAVTGEDICLCVLVVLAFSAVYFHDAAHLSSRGFRSGGTVDDDSDTNYSLKKML